MRKLVERIILFVLGVLSAAGILFLSCPSWEDPIDTTNKWFKVTADEAIPGNIFVLDMTRGYSYTEGPYILIVVQDSENEDEVVIAFPNGGFWEAPVLNPELNKSTAWEKKY